MHRKRSSSGWAQLAAWLDAPSIWSIISGVPIQPSSTVRDLGAYIDSGTSFTDHVTKLTWTCFFHIRQLRSIRRSLTVDSSHALAWALILTRLDYCNGLRWGAEVPPQPVVSSPAGCSSFDPAASTHQQCLKRDSHRAALAGCTCEGDFQAVLACSSVSSWVGSALPDPVLHTGQLNRWTLTSPFGRHGRGVWAWIADVDNWTSGVRHLFSVCMEQSLGWSAWSRAQSSDFQTSTQNLFV